MNYNANVYGTVSIILDVMLIIVIICSLFINGKHLFKQENQLDKSFRFILFCTAFAFIIANSWSLVRHLNFFFYNPVTKFNYFDAVGLILDRSFMVATGVGNLALTIKYKLSWYTDK